MSLPKINRLAVICSHPVQYYAPLFELMAEKHDVKVFYSKPNHQKKYDKEFGLDIEWDVPLLQGYNYEFSQGLTSINHYKPSAILVYGWAYLSHLIIIRHFASKLPVFFKGDSTLMDQTSRWRQRMKSIWLKALYSHVDYALYVGLNNKAYFKKYGLGENQLIFSPHAVDNARFSVDRNVEAAGIRKRLGVDACDNLILFTGKFIAKKNPELLLKAFMQLDLPGTHLLFVGNGILEVKLKALTTGACQNGKVHFLPFQNQQQMPAVYQCCDLFCLPSAGPGESWGLAINEAMAAGKPVLSSSQAGASLDLVDETNGAVFKSEDINDLKAKLSALTAEKSTLKQMGAASLSKIQNWSFKHQLSAIYGN